MQRYEDTLSDDHILDNLEVCYRALRREYKDGNLYECHTWLRNIELWSGILRERAENQINTLDDEWYTGTNWS